MVREIRLGVTLRGWQEEILKNDKRFQVLVCHRRAGKTIISLLKLLKDALTNDKKYYGYISPTYKQSKLIAWDILGRMVKDIPGVQINQSELKVSFDNGSKIQLFGADNPDSLRGLDLYGVVFDEYAQQPSNIYGEIVFPMINANNGWVTYIGTPKGKNEFYKLYAKALKDDKYYTKLLTVDESGLLDEEQLKSARQEMTAEEYDQEYNCSWEASIRGAYYKKEISDCRKEGRIKEGIYDTLLPVYTFWDLGMSDTMAILFVQVYGNTIRVIDSYDNNGEGFEHYAKIIRGKPYDYATHFFPHDIAVRELTTGQSRLETVEHIFGIDKVKVLPKLAIMDGINALRRIFHNIWFEKDKTEQLIESLSLYRQRYDERRGIFLDNPEHDWTSHYADSARYMAVGYNEIVRPMDNEEELITIDFSGEF